MSGYTKLFSSIVHSTVWREKNHVRLVWVTLLAIADRDGHIEASVPGLADAARVTIEECEDAIARLSAPDPYSRSREHEGRRITEIDGGWSLLNHSKYRDKSSYEEQKEKAAERKRRQRLKRDNRDMSRSVTPSHASHDIASPSPSPKADPPVSPPLESRPVPEPKPEPEPETPKRRKPKTPIRADWTPNAAHASKAATLGLNLDAEARKFRNNAEGKDVRWVDWDKAFHNWLENGAVFAANGNNGKAPGALDHERQQAAENARLIEQARRGEYGERTQRLAAEGRLSGELLKRFKEAVRTGNLKRRVPEPTRPSEPVSSPRATDGAPVPPGALTSLLGGIGRSIS